MLSHLNSIPPTILSAARFATATELACLLQETRQRTLGLLDDYVRALGTECIVPQGAELNPPLWELCHVAWFQDWWLSRNPQWKLGTLIAPTIDRLPSRLPDSDWRLDSSLIAHERRWDIGLPNLDGTRAYLESSLNDNLKLLETLDPVHATDQELYFFRLSVFHEQMHNEAAVFMAKMLNIPLRAEVSGYAQLADFSQSRTPTLQISLPSGDHFLGWKGQGFAFDNELPGHSVHIHAFEMDSQPVSWQYYLEFAQATSNTLPVGIEFREGQWWNTWSVGSSKGPGTLLDLNAAACNVSWDDAQAYCAWAGRRLPTEAEWEYAVELHAAEPNAAQLSAMQSTPRMVWGEVWEWTANTFLPYCGNPSDFEMHPYQDYSKPWFHDRKVLKGGSWAASYHMKHPKYRNFFQPDRRDVLSGFRTCKL
jgi:ergothioneine biosynthesis protein EgtB